MGRIVRVIATWLAGVVLIVAANAGDELRFTADGERPILSLTRSHAMVRGVADTPLVRVYGDGQVLVHVPAYMKAPGHYRYRLDRAELDALLRELDGFGLFAFDEAAARAQIAAARSARQAATGERFLTLDATRLRIDLAFAGFARGGATGAALVQTIEWADPAIDAQRHGQVAAIVGLAAAEKTLLSLVDHPARRAVKAPAGE